jgi:hypothetical protein
MKKYISSKNTFTIVVLWCVVIILIVLLIYGIVSGEAELAAILIIGAVTTLIIWTLLDTRYVIKNDFLFYRSGPFRSRISIKNIKKIQYYSGLFVPVTTKPALDSKGYIISYNNNEDGLFVSPLKAEDFVKELLKINPKIEVL